LPEVEHRERARASEYEDLKKDFEDMRVAYDAMVKEKAEVEEIERTKLQRFQDSLHKKLAELRRDMEASVATLDGRSAEFPTDASLSDFLEWF
jgi:predicted nuclease with TOPRIM domain